MILKSNPAKNVFCCGSLLSHGILLLKKNKLYYKNAKNNLLTGVLQFMDIQQKALEIINQAAAAMPGSGIQFCVFKDGKCIVNAFSGHASFDLSRKVNENTLFPIYSTSKSVPAAALTRLIEQGKVSPDQKVTDFWPEFGKLGKENTLVRHILNHTSGFPQRFKEQTSYEAISDWNTMIHAIENTPCDWTPGTKTRYQSLSYGWLTAELIQRITKMSFKEYIIKELNFKDDGGIVFGLNDETEKLTAEFKLAENCTKSSSFSKCDPIDDLMQEPLIRRMIQPGFNGFASAYGLASFMNDIISYKFFNRQSLLDATSIAYRPETCKPSQEHKCFGYGFALSGPASDPGLNFGHGGYGGSEAVAGRDNGIACGFTSNVLCAHENVKSELLGLVGIKLREGWEK